MSLATGDNFVLGDVGSYQEWNRLKNHWRASASPATPQPGMLFSDADDNKLYHCISASPVWDEILQASLSFDTTPIFDNLILDVDDHALSDPPTDAELSATFPFHPEGFIGIVQSMDSAADVYFCIFKAGFWHYTKMTLAI